MYKLLIISLFYSYTGKFFGGNKLTKFPSCSLRCPTAGCTDRSTGSYCRSTIDVIPLLFDLDTVLIFILTSPLITLGRHHTCGLSRSRKVCVIYPLSLVIFKFLLQGL